MCRPPAALCIYSQHLYIPLPPALAIIYSLDYVDECVDDPVDQGVDPQLLSVYILNTSIPLCHLLLLLSTLSTM